METKVTEVEFIPIKPRDGLIAIASCIIDNKIYIGSLGIQTQLTGDYGSLRLIWPTREIKDEDGSVIRQINIFHPLTKETCKAIEKAVLGKYETIMKNYYKDLKFTDEINAENLHT